MTDLPSSVPSAHSAAIYRYAVELVRNGYYAMQPELVAPSMTPAPVNLAVIGVSFFGFIAIGTARFVHAERNR